MDVKLDWLSYTVPTPDFNGVGELAENWTAWVYALGSLPGEVAVTFDRHVWKLERGSRVYHSRYRDNENGFRFSWGIVNPHVYVEVPGTACDQIYLANALDDLIQSVHFRLSRVDVAIDFDTDDLPTSIIGNIENVGRLSVSTIRSLDGESVYIGSRKSERFFRLYRYHPPHPRANRTRLEAELKGKRARWFADLLMREGLLVAAEQTFRPVENTIPLLQWQHARLPKQPVARSRLDRAGKVRWLLQAVTPALLTLQREREFDVLTYLRQIVLPALERIVGDADA